MKPKICMITMFKNEAHTIGRMLESVAPHISYWVIQDNGSTDGTPEIVKEWADKYDIPGILYNVSEGWVGFGWNRDHVLQKAKSVDHGCDWIMKMDCDEVLEVDEDFDWSLFDDLSNQTLTVPSKAPGVIYQRAWIWRADLNWKFHHDPAHETIYLDDGVTNESFQTAVLPMSFRMVAYDDVRGESYASPTKYVSDALKIEEKMIREGTILTDTYHFWYIAKSYEDAYKCQTFPLAQAQANHYAERAIFYYKEWLEKVYGYDWNNPNPYFNEMAYYSMFSIGNCYRYLKQHDKAIDAYERASVICPMRNEHLLFLAEIYWELRNYKKMHEYTSIMVNPDRKIPYPDCVFILVDGIYSDGDYPKTLHAIAQANLNTPEIEGRFLIGANKKPRVWVVDNFYSDPDAVRDLALQVEFEPSSDWYKGSRSLESYRPEHIKHAFEKIMGRKINNWNDHGMNGRFQFCIPQDPIVYHYDSQTWAALVYLNPNAPFEAGTSFYAHKASKILHYKDDVNDSCFSGGFYDSTKFELVDMVGNVYNRLVIFDAQLFHSATKYFGTNREDSRLFHIFFFD